MTMPIIGVYNDAHIAQLFENYRRDPSSVDESWRQYFAFAESLGGVGAAPAAAAEVDDAILRKVAGAASLVAAIRTFGHFAVHLDPLGSDPPGAVDLTAEFHGITEQDLADVPGHVLGFPDATAADAVSRLRAAYSGTIGYEFAHIEDDDEREWLRERAESAVGVALSGDEKRALLDRLTEVDGLERFIARAYPNMKRFSIEGTDMIVPIIDVAIDEGSKTGTREVVIGMAHRGRINVLAHILTKPYGTIFNEFEGKHAVSGAGNTGDVKYHLGAQTTRRWSDGREVLVSLVPNPSHLEIVNPVLAGVARAKATMGHGVSSVLPIAIHGDAAFPGEGVVAETFNMSRLPGYQVGGTLHIIVNNQIGFTTDPLDARSTYYASDLAKGFEVPIIHVNADDVQACVHAIRMAMDYRTRFGRDFLIDLVGYRRWGHNEGDEPTYTQPVRYALIKAHPTSRQVWANRLAAEGIVTVEEAEAKNAQQQARFDQLLAEAHERHREADDSENGHHAESHRYTPTSFPPIETAVNLDVLFALNEQLLTWPSALAVHPRLAKQLQRRREALGDAGGIDWGHAEALAFASLVAEGVDVRLTGQDVERGTFSHRHAVLNDYHTGQKYTPLQHIQQAQGRFEICNSPLTELAVLGFEYGYSTAALDSLVLWEAQFGDFVNMAAPVIDQFLAADRAKWHQDSGVVLLLPHGYEGQGPEHSSARLERFLQSCAEGNMRVAYPSSSAQYFHVLRRQAKLSVKRPLILMQPKSMLRLPEAAVHVNQLATGRFHTVLDDPAVERREDVTRLVFCTGKIYYDLVGGNRPPHLAVVRIEQLYPWASEDVSRVVDLYPNIAEIVWAQEEPKNMGAWTYVAPRLRASAGTALIIRYIGRPERASPAEGYTTDHNAEQARIVSDVHAAPIIPRSRILR